MKYKCDKNVDESSAKKKNNFTDAEPFFHRDTDKLLSFLISPAPPWSPKRWCCIILSKNGCSMASFNVILWEGSYSNIL